MANPANSPAPSPQPSAPLPAAAGPGAGIADPAPLGLAAFAGTTFFLSIVNTNMLGTFAQTTVLGLALAYGGIGQLLAGMWEFAKGNTFGALAFSSYGAFWISFWYLIDHVIPGQVGAVKEPSQVLIILHGVGVYLLMWGIFTAYMSVAATRVSGAVLVVFVLLTLAFFALAIGFLAESVTDFEKNSNFWIHLGGWIGILTALAAWYTSFAGVTAFTFKRPVLPTYPR
jgi:succinate-acetate transporter protein